MQFVIHGSNGSREKRFYYDNETSHLTDESGKRIVNARAPKTDDWDLTERTSLDEPSGKLAEIRTMKIQLGLSCNYSCEYCSQRFVPHAENGHPTDITKFVRNLDLWLKSVPRKIEFWGGEPFVYWKTLKPLAEALREKFPNVKFIVITNGSLLTLEINEWLDRLNFGVGISHDGPGQHVRGPDPLADPEQRKIILDLFRRLRGRVSFNAVLNRNNFDRAAIQEFFRNVHGHQSFQVGEGGFIDAYDEGGVGQSLQSHDEALAFRKLAISHIRAGKVEKFMVTQNRIQEWIRSISHGRPADVVGQKCGMDRPDTIAVDLKGNVLTCQNTTTASRAPNGQSHHIGHVSRLDAVKLNTSTHWSKRADCPSCPLVQVCRGSCMFLEGPLWDKACNNAYNDHLPFFAAAIERLTGYLPFKIESPTLPAERSVLWE
jgi:uncharacterized protein